MADLLVRGGDDVVEQLAQDRARELARLLDGDALGDRVPVLRAAGKRGDRLGLHPDQPDVRAQLAEGNRDPGREPTAADRNDDGLEDRELLSQRRGRSCPGRRSRARLRTCTNVAPVAAIWASAAARDSSKPTPSSTTRAP